MKKTWNKKRSTQIGTDFTATRNELNRLAEKRSDGYMIVNRERTVAYGPPGSRPAHVLIGPEGVVGMYETSDDAERAKTADVRLVNHKVGQFLPLPYLEKFDPEHPIGSYRIKAKGMPEHLLVKVECPDHANEPDRLWVKVMLDDPNPMLRGFQFQVYMDEIHHLHESFRTGDFTKVVSLPLLPSEF